MKKCVVINDLSGYGKCSLSASIPIISVMGSEVHPLPTSVLSAQTAFNNYCCCSLTDFMKDSMEKWKETGAYFDCILTGFVSNEKQIDIINEFTDYFKNEKTVLIVDPVMADENKMYDGYTKGMCQKLRKLCRKADIITPNVSELAILANERCSNDEKNIDRYAEKLLKEGVKKIVVTGVNDRKDFISNYVYDCGVKDIVSVADRGGYYSGTGDILASVIAGGVLRGMSLLSSVKLAADFIEMSIMRTDSDDHRFGIDFEKCLHSLL